jgi:hypothetical protein
MFTVAWGPLSRCVPNLNDMGIAFIVGLLVWLALLHAVFRWLETCENLLLWKLGQFDDEVTVVVVALEQGGSRG